MAQGPGPGSPMKLRAGTWTHALAVQMKELSAQPGADGFVTIHLGGETKVTGTIHAYYEDGIAVSDEKHLRFIPYPAISYVSCPLNGQGAPAPATVASLRL